MPSHSRSGSALASVPLEPPRNEPSPACPPPVRRAPGFRDPWPVRAEVVGCLPEVATSLGEGMVLIHLWP